MTTIIKRNGKSSSIPGGMVIAAAASMLITVAASAAIANFLDNERITWEQAGFWIMGMLFAASFAGGKCAYASIKRQRIAVSIMAGVIYWGMLLCTTALFFGGKFSAVWETAAIISAGCVTSALLSLPSKNKYGIKKGRGYR